MIFLFYQEVSHTLTSYGKETIELRPGLYDIECFGAKGGDSYKDNNNNNKLYEGGHGSYAHAKIKVKKTNIDLNIEIGEKVSWNPISRSDGGEPYNRYSGSGGASSRVKLGDNILIVAAGGSGASTWSNGAPGGGNNTCFYKEYGREKYVETNESIYMTEDQINKNGKMEYNIPGSGGGGGYKCGIGGWVGNNPSGVGVSGTSFISDDELIVFSEVFNGSSRPSNLNGKVTIKSEYICIDNCSDCENGEKCLKCDSSHVLYDDKCELTTCPIGYIEEDRVCKQCPEGQFSKENSCFDSCGEGYFEDTTNKACIGCSDPNCNQCLTGKDICTQCENNYLLHGSKCVSNCPSGFYPSDGRCLECEVNCLTCSNRETCISCKPGFSLKGTQCVETCGDGYFLDSTNNICQKCSDNCLNCYDENTCLICNSNFFLKDHKCVESCGDGYYIDSANRRCSKCSDNCLRCNNESTCSTCYSNFFIKESQCVSSCGSRYYQNNEAKNCTSCSNLNCDLCLMNRDLCNFCKYSRCATFRISLLKPHTWISKLKS